MKKKTIRFFRELFHDLTHDRIMNESAILAFYTTLSLPSFLYLLMIVGNFFIGRNSVQQELLRVSNLIFENNHRLVSTIIEQTPSFSIQQAGSSIVTVLILIFGASGIFSSLKNGIHELWHITPKEYVGSAQVKRHIANTVLLFLIMTIFGLLFLITILLDLLITSPLLTQQILFHFPTYIVQIANTFITFFLLVGFISIIFKFLPDAHVPWKIVLYGSICTALLLMSEKYILRVYMSYSNIGNTYGNAASGIIIGMVWIYVSAFIIFFGAKTIYTYARVFGTPIKPNIHARMSGTFLERAHLYLRRKHLW